MRLYHSTTDLGLRGIIADNVIRQSSAFRLDDGTEIAVVWLSDRLGGWFRKEDGTCKDRDTHIVVVDLPDDAVVPWTEFRNPPFPQNTIWSLETTAQRPGMGDPATWLVIDRPIPQSEWVEIICVADGEVVWTPATGTGTT